jgi:group I intron endonuclease
MSIEERWRHHKGSTQRGSDHKFHRAIRKYGEENFLAEEVLTVSAPTKEILKKKLDYVEIRLIKKLGTRHNGYNITDGGEGRLGYEMSEEHRKKISKARLGTHLSEETKEKLRKINLGRKLSDEARQKMSEKKRGKAGPWKGRHRSEETKRKISESLKGNIPWNKGLHKI